MTIYVDQDVTQILAAPTAPNARVDQDLISLLAVPTNPHALIDQDLLHVLTVPTTANAHVTQNLIQVLTVQIVEVHSASPYLRDALANHIFRTASLAKLALGGIWIALYTWPPGQGSPAVEVTGGGYQRLQTFPADSVWTPPASGNGVFTNAIDFVFPTPTADWGTLTGWAMLDASSGGNLLYYSTFSSAIAVNTGSNPRFPAGSLTVTFA